MSEFETPSFEEKASESNGISVDRYTELDISGWKEWIEAELSEFKGNKENAASLLFELSQGVKWTLDKFKSKGLAIKDPIFGILKRLDYPNLPQIGYDPIGNAIFVTEVSLVERSQLKVEEKYTLSQEGGGVVHEGTILDFFRLAGVEEAHHAVYTQYKGVEGVSNDPNMEVSEYHASDVEFRASRMQIKHAVEESMHPDTIDTLKKIHEAAKEIRKNKSINPTL